MADTPPPPSPGQPTPDASPAPSPGASPVSGLQPLKEPKDFVMDPELYAAVVSNWAAGTASSADVNIRNHILALLGDGLDTNRGLKDIFRLYYYINKAEPRDAPALRELPQSFFENRSRQKRFLQNLVKETILTLRSNPTRKSLDDLANIWADGQISDAAARTGGDIILVDVPDINPPLVQYNPFDNQTGISPLITSERRKLDTPPPPPDSGGDDEKEEKKRKAEEKRKLEEEQKKLKEALEKEREAQRKILEENAEKERKRQKKLLKEQQESLAKELEDLKAAEAKKLQDAKEVIIKSSPGKSAPASTTTTTTSTSTSTPTTTAPTSTATTTALAPVVSPGFTGTVLASKTLTPPPTPPLNPTEKAAELTKGLVAHYTDQNGTRLSLAKLLGKVAQNATRNAVYDTSFPPWLLHVAGSIDTIYGHKPSPFRMAPTTIQKYTAYRAGSFKPAYFARILRVAPLLEEHLVEYFDQPGGVSFVWFHYNSTGKGRVVSRDESIVLDASKDQTDGYYVCGLAVSLDTITNILKDNLASSGSLPASLEDALDELFGAGFYWPAPDNFLFFPCDVFQYIIIDNIMTVVHHKDHKWTLDDFRQSLGARAFIKNIPHNGSTLARTLQMEESELMEQGMGSPFTWYQIEPSLVPDPQNANQRVSLAWTKLDPRTYSQHITDIPYATFVLAEGDPFRVGRTDDSARALRLKILAVVYYWNEREMEQRMTYKSYATWEDVIEDVEDMSEEPRTTGVWRGSFEWKYGLCPSLQDTHIGTTREGHLSLNHRRLKTMYKNRLSLWNVKYQTSNASVSGTVDPNSSPSYLLKEQWAANSRLPVLMVDAFSLATTGGMPVTIHHIQPLQLIQIAEHDGAGFRDDGSVIVDPQGITPNLTQVSRSVTSRLAQTSFTNPLDGVLWDDVVRVPNVQMAIKDRLSLGAKLLIPAKLQIDLSDCPSRGALQTRLIGQRLYRQMSFIGLLNLIKQQLGPVVGIKDAVYKRTMTTSWRLLYIKTFNDTYLKTTIHNTEQYVILWLLPLIVRYYLGIAQKTKFEELTPHVQQMVLLLMDVCADVLDLGYAFLQETNLPKTGLNGENVSPDDYVDDNEPKEVSEGLASLRPGGSRPPSVMDYTKSVVSNELEDDKDNEAASIHLLFLELIRHCLTYLPFTSTHLELLLDWISTQTQGVLLPFDPTIEPAVYQLFAAAVDPPTLASSIRSLDQFLLNGTLANQLVPRAIVGEISAMWIPTSGLAEYLYLTTVPSIPAAVVPNLRKRLIGGEFSDAIQAALSEDVSSSIRVFRWANVFFSNWQTSSQVLGTFLLTRPHKHRMVSVDVLNLFEDQQSSMPYDIEHTTNVPLVQWREKVNPFLDQALGESERIDNRLHEINRMVRLLPSNQPLYLLCLNETAASPSRKGGRNEVSFFTNVLDQLDRLGTCTSTFFDKESVVTRNDQRLLDPFFALDVLMQVSTPLWATIEQRIQNSPIDPESLSGAIDHPDTTASPEDKVTHELEIFLTRYLLPYLTTSNQMGEMSNDLLVRILWEFWLMRLETFLQPGSAMAKSSLGHPVLDLLMFPGKINYRRFTSLTFQWTWEGKQTQTGEQFTHNHISDIYTLAAQQDMIAQTKARLNPFLDFLQQNQLIRSYHHKLSHGTNKISIALTSRYSVRRVPGKIGWPGGPTIPIKPELKRLFDWYAVVMPSNSLSKKRWRKLITLGSVEDLRRIVGNLSMGKSRITQPGGNRIRAGDVALTPSSSTLTYYLPQMKKQKYGPAYKRPSLDPTSNPFGIADGNWISNSDQRLEINLANTGSTGQTDLDLILNGKLGDGTARLQKLPIGKIFEAKVSFLGPVKVSVRKTVTQLWKEHKPYLDTIWVEWLANLSPVDQRQWKLAIDVLPKESLKAILLGKSADELPKEELIEALKGPTAGVLQIIAREGERGYEAWIREVARNTAEIVAKIRMARARIAREITKLSSEGLTSYSQ